MELKVDKDSPLPIYHQIAASLKKFIENGKLKPRARLPSEMNVSKALDVSPMTVRQAYTRLVEDGLLYRRHGKGTFVSENPCPKKASSAFSKTGVDFGVLLFNSRTMLSSVPQVVAMSRQAQTFGSELIMGLEAACASHNVNFHLLSANGKSLCSADNAVLEELLSNHRMDALLLAGTPLKKDDIDRLIALGMPIVSIDSDYGRREIPTVLLDDKSFSKLAAKCLVERGFERLLLVTGPLCFGEGPRAMQRRGGRIRDAFFDTLPSLGLKRSACRHFECELDIFEIEKAVKDAFSVPPGRRPQAVITDGDTAALGAFKTIRSLDSAGDEEIPILNFADSPQSPFPFIVKPIDLMAAAAVDILERGMRDLKFSGTKIIPLELKAKRLKTGEH